MADTGLEPAEHVRGGARRCSSSPLSVLVTGATGRSGGPSPGGSPRTGRGSRSSGATRTGSRPDRRRRRLADDALVPVVGELPTRAAAQAVVDAVGGALRADRRRRPPRRRLGRRDPGRRPRPRRGRARCSTSTCGRRSTSPRRPSPGWSSAGSVGSSRSRRRSRRNPAGAAGYAVAKSAEEALVRTLAREVAGTGVTANLLAIRTLDRRARRAPEPTRRPRPGPRPRRSPTRSPGSRHRPRRRSTARGSRSTAA